MNATMLARNMVRQLIENGVSDFVLSPGSRNAPLSIALYEAETAGIINVYVRIDERGAAFFALGLSKATDNYVAVICTSGTAAANFHPALLEAYHSANKLLVITADRPARLRRTGANQTTLHVGLLEPVKTFDIAQAADISHLITSGPAHLNIQFDEPLMPDDRSDWLAGMAPHATEYSKEKNNSVFYPLPHGVVVVGHDRAGLDKESITHFATTLGWPLIAEDPLSFPTSIAHAALFLSDSGIRTGFKPEQIIIIGRTTLSRSISALISECEDVIVVDPRALTIDTARSASEIFNDLPDFHLTSDANWLKRWHEAAAIADKAIKLSWSEQAAIKVIVENIPDEAALFVGSSRPIRDIEAFARPRSGISTFANRGLAGIDGNLSCAFGIAEKFERSFAIIGDITFLHDISAMANPSAANLTIFIIDNNGGGIFNTLPQSGVDGFEKIFGTPHNLDLENVIHGFGSRVTKVKNQSDLIRSIMHFTPGLNFVVVEVPDRVTNASNLKTVTQSLVSALRIGNNLA
ncbi:MAG TPA: 2-succinyl-5-enolpyruvyl-6-hydroxy-3-cyclohexene-1-carboxylic-acid synthase [Candidatus Nanopelagicaceae bacterium]